MLEPWPAHRLQSSPLAGAPLHPDTSNVYPTHEIHEKRQANTNWRFERCQSNVHGVHGCCFCVYLRFKGFLKGPRPPERDQTRCTHGIKLHTVSSWNWNQTLKSKMYVGVVYKCSSNCLKYISWQNYLAWSQIQSLAQSNTTFWYHLRLSPL